MEILFRPDAKDKEKKIEFRLKSSMELKTLTVRERQDYCAALLEELKRLHAEFDENVSKAERDAGKETATPGGAHDRYRRIEFPDR